MKRSAAILLVALPGLVLAQRFTMPDWALRALNNGVSEARVELAYELNDACVPTNVRVAAAFPPDPEWQEGEMPELLRRVERYLGPYDTTDGRWPLVKETAELGHFEAAHYRSHNVHISASGRSMTLECVFESGRLLYVEARTSNADGRPGPPERLESPLSSLGTSTLTLRFVSNDEILEQ